ncbi:MAG: c-type cytochrome biogenesis protein CcmI [Betaproteobacteria bacterium]|nr:c-type cytochrome biogenesis protein CcmI [Betaproteobacteria bacterium]NBQ77068.1 c-type cytochrome biogenesis protein CcmI [Betaproteobacteria bacterium]NCY07066.1 c-type cytochrome biogenesis protein CcmI [Betaproteobacteria bacterium]NDC02189.1 c-type cytochrome biogenesis protein CcmI [Betaproteobacteria bacterium]NDC84876.1 c-type cytochrome biogenesis protein CcmI [Betaproteobacteria bacterium]
MFLSLGLLLVLGTAFVLIWPLLRRDPPVDRGPSEEAIAAVFKERRTQIQAELKAGLIQAQDAQSAEEALTQELADRLSALPPAGIRRPRSQQDAHGQHATNPVASVKQEDPRRPWLAGCLALCLPVFGLSIYFLKGSPELALPGANLSTQSPAGVRSIEELANNASVYQSQVEQWKRELQIKPDDVNTWLSLALLQKAAGNYAESLQSFSEALKRGADQDGRSLAEFAETVALGRGKRFDGEPYELLKRAISLEPHDAKVVSLMAAAHFQAGEKAQARGLLEQLLSAMPKDSAQAEQLRSLIASLPGSEPNMASPTSPSPTSPSPARDRQPSQAVIEVTVAIPPAMLSNLAPSSVLYVSARAAQGPRMPLAVWRSKVTDIKFVDRAHNNAATNASVQKPPANTQAAAQDKTLVVTLSQAEQLDPSRPLAGELIVEAHISQSGLAGRQAGDPIAQGKAVSVSWQGDRTRLRLDLDDRYKP